MEMLILLVAPLECLRNRARGLGLGCTRHEIPAKGAVDPWLKLSNPDLVVGRIPFSDPFSRHCLGHHVSLAMEGMRMDMHPIAAI